MQPEIEHTSPVPVHEQITRWIRQNILTGTWQENQKLKSEIELAQELGVSRGTVRRAIETLTMDGLLVRIHGKGTFVRSNLILEQKPSSEPAGFSRDLLNRGIPFTTEVLLNEVIRPPQKIAGLLGITTRKKIFHMHRLRKIHDRPVLMIENHIIYDYCPGIEKIDFSKQQLYNTLETVYHFQLDWAHRTFWAKVADELIAKHLQIMPGEPILFFEQLYYIKGEIPVEFTRAWMNAQIFPITNIITREEEKKDQPRLYR